MYPKLVWCQGTVMLFPSYRQTWHGPESLNTVLSFCPLAVLDQRLQLSLPGLGLVVLSAVLFDSFGHNSVCCSSLCPCHSFSIWEGLLFFPNMKPKPLSSASRAHSRALAAALVCLGFDPEDLVESMCHLPGQVPSILYCSCLNPIKHKCD